MSKLPINVANVQSALSIAVLEQGLTLCNRIMEYKIATKHIECQLEQMHTQADLELKSLQAELESTLAKTHTLGRSHTKTLKANTKSIYANAEIIKDNNQIILQIIGFLKDVTDPSIIAIFNTQLNEMQERQKLLIEKQGELTKMPMQAFRELNDTLSNRMGRTFEQRDVDITDV